MHLVRARVQSYRSIRDTGFFDVEPGKTIMVSANEAGTFCNAVRQHSTIGYHGLVEFERKVAVA